MYISKKKFSNYQGSWVAMNKKTEEVLASSPSFSVVYSKASKIKEVDSNDILVQYILPFNLKLSPSSI